jgi:hypothetical protein
MAEWSEDHMAAIGSIKLEPWNHWWNWFNWRLGGALRWKAKTPVGKVRECDVEIRHL